MKVYSAYCNDMIRLQSSSGGVFTVIANQFDVVYGVALSQDCYEAKFVRIDDGNIEKIRGSKYVQAKLGKTFEVVKEDLANGKKVLFSGTGCQVNGLKSYLQKEYDNLTTVDVICHGVPSELLWKSYMYSKEKIYGKIENVNFRSKDRGWSNYGIKLNGNYISKKNDSYMRMFLRDYCLRPSCYKCYAKKVKMADITIGDFWGIDQVVDGMNDKKGVNLVIIRTTKGNEIFETIKDKLIWKEVEYKDAVKYNQSEYVSVTKPSQREMFYYDLRHLSFENMEKKYAGDVKKPFIKVLKNKVKGVLRFINKN